MSLRWQSQILLDRRVNAVGEILLTLGESLETRQT